MTVATNLNSGGWYWSMKKEGVFLISESIPIIVECPNQESQQYRMSTFCSRFPKPIVSELPRVSKGQSVTKPFSSYLQAWKHVDAELSSSNHQVDTTKVTSSCQQQTVVKLSEIRAIKSTPLKLDSFLPMVTSFKSTQHQSVSTAMIGPMKRNSILRVSDPLVTRY